MYFHLNEVNEEFKRMIADFAKREVAPLAAKTDEEGRFPEVIFKKLADLGLMGMMIPEEYGGSGGDLWMTAAVAEEVASACASTALSWGAHLMLTAWTINTHGNADQKRRFLPILASGKGLGAFALTEPQAGSDAASLRTKAVKSGNGYVINGSKTFITNGSIAKVMIVFARTEDNRESKGISAFLVEGGAKGLGVSKEIKKMGMRGSPTAELYFEDMFVPAENLLGSEGEGLKIALGAIENERVVAIAMAIGIARCALETAVDYAAQRTQFGQPIANFQMVQEMIAEIATNIFAMRSILSQALFLKQKGKKMRLEAAMSKLFCGRAAVDAALKAIQILGGYGYTRDYPVERLLRDAKLLEIGGGTNEIQKLIIAKEMIKRGGKI